MGQKYFNSSEIDSGYHPDGFRIDKKASPIDMYTKWSVSIDGTWLNPKPVCFHSLPVEGWIRADKFELGQKNR